MSDDLKLGILLDHTHIDALTNAARAALVNAKMDPEHKGAAVAQTVMPRDYYLKNNKSLGLVRVRVIIDRIEHVNDVDKE